MMEIDVKTPSFRGFDKKWEHHLRQSDINDFRMCPEMKRYKMNGVEFQGSDVALIGTSCHAGFEVLLAGNVDTLEEAVEIAHEVLNESWANVQKNDVPNWADAAYKVAGILQTFWNEVYDELLQKGIVSTEQKFDVKVNETSSRRLFLAGTSDLWLDDSIVDFKTSKKNWKRDEWKVNRYNVQSTVYAWARDQIELAKDGKFTLDFKPGDELYPVRFIVFDRDTFAWHDVTVQRTVADCQFLLRELEAMCNAIEYLPANSWPLRPDDWFCSPKWCPAWDQCRGKQLGPDPWGLLNRHTPNAAQQAVSLIDSAKKLSTNWQMQEDPFADDLAERLEKSLEQRQQEHYEAQVNRIQRAKKADPFAGLPNYS